MAERAVCAAAPGLAAAAQRLATTGAGLRGAVLHSLDSGAQPGEIASWLLPLADPETSARVLASDEIRETLRELVERYAAREFSARWSS